MIEVVDGHVKHRDTRWTWFLDIGLFELLNLEMLRHVGGANFVSVIWHTRSHNWTHNRRIQGVSNLLGFHSCGGGLLDGTFDEGFVL